MGCCRERAEVTARASLAFARWLGAGEAGAVLERGFTFETLVGVAG